MQRDFSRGRDRGWSAPALVAALAVAGCAPKGDRAGPDAGQHPAAQPPREKASSVEQAQPDAPATGVVAGIEPAEDPPLYGRAVWNIVTVQEKPDLGSSLLGYLKKGGIVVLEDAMVEDGTSGKPSCRKGWWMLADGGGYICSAKGVEAGHELVPSNLYPMPPAIDAPMPFSYGHVLSDLVPLYERPPTAAEEALVEEWVKEKRKELAKLELEKEAAELKAAAKKKPGPDEPEAPGAGEEPPGGEEPAPEGAGGMQQAAAELLKTEPAKQEDGTPGIPSAEPSPTPEEPAKDEAKDTPFDFVRMVMLKGFYVSIDREMIHGGMKWLRTLKGQFVKSEKVMPVNIRIRGGQELGPDFSFPAGVVLREDIYERVWNSQHTRIVKNKDVLYDKFTVLPLFKKHVQKVDEMDAIFYEVDPSGEKLVLSWSIVMITKPEPPPPEVPEGGKWIHIDVSDQTLTAYEGTRPVFLTLVSTGNEEKDEEFKTPRGTFSMMSKHVSATMDNLALDDTAYSIEDVPWTMYFLSNYALHGAFWHSAFGHMRSHGCVNMTPSDAKWIFDWSEPRLPFGWHGVIATKDRPGTIVRITD